MVSQLFDPREPQIPRAVFAHRQGEQPWKAVQSHCDTLPGKLAAFCRMLLNEGLEPLARPLLGSRVALDEPTAHAVCRFRVAEISRMAGCPPGQVPDFLIVSETNHGSRRRPVTKIGTDGTAVHYRAVREAARAEHVAPVSIRRRISRGHRGPDGAVWPPEA